MITTYKNFPPFEFDENKEDIVVKDGFPYCKKCGGKRFYIMEEFNRICPVICKCQQEEIEKQKEEERIRKVKEEFYNKQKMSMLGARYREATFDNAIITENNRDAYTRLRNYAKHSDKMIEENVGIYIHGDNSSGKTHITACLCNELLSQGKSCIYTNLATIKNLIFSKKQGMEETEIFRKFELYDFVFIDDLGKEFIGREFDPGTSKWLERILFELVNIRCNANKPTIFSSNYSIDELLRILGLDKAIIERINEMSTRIILLSGDDFRDMNVKKNEEKIIQYGV